MPGTLVTWQQRFEKLRLAVLEYDRALRAYALMGAAWIEHSDELDTKWQAVIDATQAE